MRAAGSLLDQTRVIVLDVADARSPASTSLPLHAALRVTSLAPVTFM